MPYDSQRSKIVIKADAGNVSKAHTIMSVKKGVGQERN